MPLAIYFVPDLALAARYCDQGLSAAAMAALLSASALLYLLCLAILPRARTPARSVDCQPTRSQFDTLIQGVQGLMLSVQAAASRLPNTSPVRLQLEALLDDGEHLLSNARQGMRVAPPAMQGEDGLVGALLALGRQCTGRPTLVFSLTILGREQIVSPARQQALSRWADMVIRNASAQAQTIEVELCYAWGSLALRIRHDGQGTAPQPAVMALAGFRRAFPQQTPRIEIWSRPLAGSEYAVCYGAGDPSGTRFSVYRCRDGLQKALYQH
ncbi:MAG: hypothetical protein K2P77_01950 [Burkholderiaceae bacterium]|nr:hypothetical protein [Burkholderiaceae bacterium]